MATSTSRCCRMIRFTVPTVVSRATNFMVISRILPNAINITTPFIDQNQTYTSHASHQVFLREYTMDDDGVPVATGRLLSGADGGLPTWADVKAQARDLLGIQLLDKDVLSVPLLATDEYGRFIRGANGFAQIVTATGLVEGNPAANGGLGVTASGKCICGWHRLPGRHCSQCRPDMPGLIADGDNLVGTSTGPKMPAPTTTSCSTSTSSPATGAATKTSA